jgi:hypothetical protein
VVNTLAMVGTNVGLRGFSLWGCLTLALGFETCFLGT